MACRAELRRIRPPANSKPLRRKRHTSESRAALLRTSTFSSRLFKTRRRCTAQTHYVNALRRYVTRRRRANGLRKMRAVNTLRKYTAREHYTGTPSPHAAQVHNANTLRSLRRCSKLCRISAGGVKLNAFAAEPCVRKLHFEMRRRSAWRAELSSAK